MQWNRTIRITCIFHPMQPNRICAANRKVAQFGENVSIHGCFFVIVILLFTVNYRLCSERYWFPWRSVKLHREHFLRSYCCCLLCICLAHIHWCIRGLLDDFLAKYTGFRAVHLLTFSWNSAHRHDHGFAMHDLRPSIESSNWIFHCLRPPNSAYTCTEGKGRTEQKRMKNIRWERGFRAFETKNKIKSTQTENVFVASHEIRVIRLIKRMNDK